MNAISRGWLYQQHVWKGFTNPKQVRANAIVYHKGFTHLAKGYLNEFYVRRGEVVLRGVLRFQSVASESIKMKKGSEYVRRLVKGIM